MTGYESERPRSLAQAEQEARRDGMTLGELFTREVNRVMSKLSEDDVCDRFDISKPILRRWRAGETVPQPATLCRVLEVLLTL